MRSIFLSLLILTSVFINAQYNQAPIEPKVYVYKIVDSDSLKAFVFFPLDRLINKKYPSIAVFHGGGWAMGEASWGFGRAQRFAEMGMVSISVQYRISDNKEITPIEAMEDTRDFFIWARENSSDLGISNESIAAYGWSAGAHLIACSAVFPSYSPDSNISSIPNALILHSPALSVINDGWFEQLLLQRGKPIEYSPAEHITGELPPSIIVIGRDDTVTPLKYSEFFQSEMLKYGNICELHVYEGVGHLFTPSDQPDNGWPNPDKEVSKKAFSDIDRFLKGLKYLK